ncbi:hypothetical protein TNCV_4128491 [Trichonephila clavipes]|nr:hypothetical protein TNCV_4128491 [Trichonephila clavipes]
MINAKKKEGFPPDPGTIVLRQKDINLITGKPFRIKTCCSSQMLINSLREDTEYLLDLGVNGMGQSIRTLPVVWLGRVSRYPYPLLCEGDTRNRWRDGQVCPDVGQGTMAPWARRLGREKTTGEREKLALYGEKGRVRDWGEKDDERRWR